MTIEQSSIVWSRDKNRLEFSYYSIVYEKEIFDMANMPKDDIRFLRTLHDGNAIFAYKEHSKNRASCRNAQNGFFGNEILYLL